MKGTSSFQIALLAIFGASAVAGMMIFAIATSTAKSSSTGPVTVWGTIDGGTFSQMISKASYGNPTLSTVTYVQHDPATYLDDITSALAEGTGPDLFFITADQAYSDVGKVIVLPYTSVSQTQYQNAFIQAADSFLSPKGVIALPIAADPLVLYWNKDMLATAGYAQPPQYWDQIFDMATKMTQRDDAGTILKSAIALGSFSNVDNAKDIIAALSLQAGGTITAYDPAGRLTSTMSKTGINPSEPAVLTALRFYVEFADPSKNDYSWNGALPQASQDFAQGNLALYIGYASEEPTIRKENPNLNFAVAALPQIRGAAHSTDVARVYGLAVSRTSQNPNGAEAVAATLVQSANSAAFATTFNLASARRDVLSQAASGEQSLFNSEAIISYGWTDPNPDKTAAIFQAMIDDTTSGVSDIGGAVSKADAQMNQLISSQSQ